MDCFAALAMTVPKIEQDGGEFVALRSPDTAEDDPHYRELGRFLVIPGWSGGPDPE